MLNRKERPKISTAIRLLDFINEHLVKENPADWNSGQMRKWNNDVKHILNDILNRNDVVEVKK